MESHDDNNTREAASPTKGKNKGRGVIGSILRDFFLGCIAFVPLAILIFITYHTFNLLYSLGRIFFGLTASRETSAALLALVAVILVYSGRKLRRQERWFWNIVEMGLIRVPVLGGWYSTVRDIVQTFTSSGGEKSYMGTVAVPAGAGYIIGFVTKKEEQTDGSVTVTVFVPTSPNPTTGLVFFYPESDIRYLDISAEQAFSKVISLGMKS